MEEWEGEGAVAGAGAGEKAEEGEEAEEGQGQGNQEKCRASFLKSQYKSVCSDFAEYMYEGTLTFENVGRSHAWHRAVVVKGAAAQGEGAVQEGGGAGMAAARGS